MSNTVKNTKPIAEDAKASAIVLEDCQVYFNHQYIKLLKGEKKEGAFAEFLKQAGAPVEEVK